MRVKDDHKEQAIKQEAMKMVAESGFDAFSMQKLAKAAGVSPATIYIYFKDKQDLILRIYEEEVGLMAEDTMRGFNTSMSFAEGLRIQWQNRAAYCLKYPEKVHFLEQIKSSSLHEKAAPSITGAFKNRMKDFVVNAVKNKELVKLPLEVYWSVAFAPLYNLIRFHQAGKNMAGTPFVLTEDLMDQTLELVLKALKP